MLQYTCTIQYDSKVIADIGAGLVKGMKGDGAIASSVYCMCVTISDHP